MPDAVTMVRRNTRHAMRNPTAVVMTIAMPVLLLLLFVGVFGGAMNVGPIPAGGEYIDYVVAGILLMTVGYGSSTTALAVNRDMTDGVINRFRTMAIAQASVLTGHVVVATVRTLVSSGLVVGVALLLGFRPTADPVRWLAAVGLLALLALALTWLAVAAGLLARTAEGTSPFVLIVQVLPFLSSAFTSPATMSAPVRWFAAHQPFTPVIDSLRGLMLDAPVDDGVVAVAWCAGLALAGYLWSRALFRREPTS